MTIEIVIVNWNTGDFLRECIASIAGSEGVRIKRVTVVDNNSDDGSADGLERSDIEVRTLRNSDNRGFGAACNQGAEGSEADLLLFLNPDARLKPHTLAVAARFMESDPTVGICGGRVLHEDGTPAVAASRFPTLRIMTGKVTGLSLVAPRLFPPHHMTEDELTASGPVEQVVGAFFLIRRELFERLGGFDRRYFLYFEEVDLARRAADAGAGSYYLREAELMHAENVSSDRVPVARLYNSQRSRLLYGFAHWPRSHALVLIGVTLGVEPVARVARALAQGNVANARATLAAARRLARDIPAIISSP